MLDIENTQAFKTVQFSMGWDVKTTRLFFTNVFFRGWILFNGIIIISAILLALLGYLIYLMIV